MKTLSTFLILLIFIAMTSSLTSQVPNPAAIEKVAVYKSIQGASDELPDGQVNFNITDKGLIASMFTGIESDTLRDCSLMEAKNSAFVYVKMYNGTTQVYHLFRMYSHFSKKDDRANCFYVTPPARSLFETNAQ
jgi:hypothetical protein